MRGMSQNSQVADPYPWRWKKGTTGNAGGRRREEATIRELAQSYCPDAIRRLAKLAGVATDANGKLLPGARNETTQIAAMRELLDRGIGKPRQDLTVDVDGPPSLLAMHLTAATAVGAQLLAELHQREAINGTIINGHVEEPVVGVDDLLRRPAPIE